MNPRMVPRGLSRPSGSGRVAFCCTAAADCVAVKPGICAGTVRAAMHAKQQSMIIRLGRCIFRTPNRSFTLTAGAAGQKSRGAGRPKVFLMLAEKKLVRHARDVIAHDDVAWNAASQLFIKMGHGIELLEVEHEELLKAADGTLAILGDERVIVDVREQKTFEQG